ncbi:hypothetical protein DQG13_28170 [Paenibacillus sp. YN15]|nr:hypothetical protein DQG13_28170 [Paenibacillus sp. YN15]
MVLADKSLHQFFLQIQRQRVVGFEKGRDDGMNIAAIRTTQAKDAETDVLGSGADHALVVAVPVRPMLVLPTVGAGRGAVFLGDAMGAHQFQVMGDISVPQGQVGRRSQGTSGWDLTARRATVRARLHANRLIPASDQPAMTQKLPSRLKGGLPYLPMRTTGVYKCLVFHYADDERKLVRRKTGLQPITSSFFYALSPLLRQ